MKNTGALLKAKRESSNLSLSEVALATKINPKILAAIESGDDSGLPAKTILKGFVKSYALFLKMDVDAVLRSFNEETMPLPTETTTPESTASGPRKETVRRDNQRGDGPPPARRRVDEESSSGLRTAAVVVIVLLIGLIIGVRELIEKYQRERLVAQPVEIKVSPLEPKTETKPSTEETKTVDAEKPAETTKAAEEVKTAEATQPAEEVKPAEAAKPEETKSAEAKPAETAKAEEVAKPAEEPAKPVEPPVKPKPMDLTRGPVANLVELNPGRAPMIMIKPEAKPVEAKPNEVKTAEAKVEEAKPEEAKSQDAKPAEVAKPEETKPAATTAEPTSALKAAKNEIILEALDKVDVKFEVKGETKRVSLAPTQVHTIRSDQPLSIDVSDGGAVNVILNGRERGPAGDLGKPKTIKIP